MADSDDSFVAVSVADAATSSADLELDDSEVIQPIDTVLAAKDDEMPPHCERCIVLARRLAELQLQLADIDRERDEELQDHIETAEVLQRLEDDLRAEKIETAATHEALRKMVTQKRELEEAHADMAEQLAAFKANFESQVETARLEARKQVAAAERAQRRTARLHQEEVAALRAKMQDLTREIEGIAWTEAHRKEAASLEVEGLFARLLSATTTASCTGLVEQLLQTLPNEREWIDSSGWSERLCSWIEATRGSIVSTLACARLSSDPRLATRCLKSGLFSCLTDVLALDIQEHAAHRRALEAETDVPDNDDDDDGTNVDSLLQGSRFSRSPLDWAAIRLNIAVALHNCAKKTEGFQEPHEHIAAFVSAPQALKALIALVLRECHESQGAATAAHETLVLACDTLLAIASQVAFHDGLATHLLTSSCLSAFQKLLQHDRVRLSALQCLDFLAVYNIQTCERLISQGFVPALTQLAWLCQSQSAEESLAAALSVLLKLSRTDKFAKAFMGCELHKLVISVVERENAPLATSQLAIEVLVNVIYLRPEIGELVSSSDCMGAILTMLVAPEPYPAAVCSRLLDVTSGLLAHHPRLALHVKRDHLRALVALWKSNERLLGYKIAFFAFNFAQSPSSARHLLCDEQVFAMLEQMFASSHHMEVQEWTIVALQLAISMSLGLPSEQRIPSDQLVRLKSALAARLVDGRNADIRARVASCLLCAMHHLLVANVASSLSLISPASHAELEQAILAQSSELPAALSAMARLAEHACALDLLASLSNVLRVAFSSSKETRLDIQTVLEALCTPARLQKTPSIVRELLDSGVVGLLVELAQFASDLADLALELLESLDEASIALLLEGGCGKVLAFAMRRDNQSFKRGMKLVKRLLLVEPCVPYVLEDVGLVVILDVLQSTEDAAFHRLVAEVLPHAFASEEASTRLATSGVISHLVALVDTSTSSVELQLALDILSELVKYKKSAVNVIRHGGLRVLVDMSLMQDMTNPVMSAACGPGALGMPAFDDFVLLPDGTQLSRDDVLELGFPGGEIGGLGPNSYPTVPPSQQDTLPGASAAVSVLSQLFRTEEGGIPEDDPILKCLGEEGGIPLLLALLEQSNEMSLVFEAVRLIYMLSKTRAAREIMSCNGPAIICGVYNAPSTRGEDIQPLRHLARGSLVRLGWNVQTTSARLSQAQAFAALDDAGAVDAIADQLEERNETDEVNELRRQAGWFIATWLSQDNEAARERFIQAGHVHKLLKLDDSNATAEMQRYARLAVGKLLNSTGEQLVADLELLRARLPLVLSCHGSADLLAIVGR
eukprot:m.178832 g.178832  ORF g.178832 m.178832 type:complete len:1308 (-) comp10451_c0_seq2:110-4033(-)